MIKALGSLILFGFASTMMASVCPTTSSTNSDCGYLITISAGNTLSGMAVSGANPYDGSDDALIGVINNSGSTYTGSFVLTGSGNGGGLFAFDGDGICLYTGASYCATAPTGYEGPQNTFSNINAAGTMGTVNITNLLDGSSTFFSLESSPASINAGGGPVIVGSAPEPGSISLLGAGMLALGYLARRRSRA